jgi:hypothetical protein
LRWRGLRLKDIPNRVNALRERGDGHQAPGAGKSRGRAHIKVLSVELLCKSFGKDLLLGWLNSAPSVERPGICIQLYSFRCSTPKESYSCQTRS